MSPQWLALLEPFILSQPIGHDKVPMFFWGPLSGPGVVKKIRKVASLRDNEGLSATQTPILFFLKWPWSWWVPGSRSVKGLHQNTWKHGSRQTKESHSKLETDPAKKDIIFCDGEVFSLDRGLLMGANIQNPILLQISPKNLPEWKTGSPGRGFKYFLWFRIGEYVRS